MPLSDWRQRLIPGSAAQVGSIGLDLGSDSAHLVQLQRVGESFRARAVLSSRYAGDRDDLFASPKALKGFVRDALRRGGFRGRRVVTALPPEEVRLMVLNYQGDPEVPEPERILRLAEERTRESLSQSVVDFVPIRTSGENVGEKSALVAIAEEELVVRHLERLRAAGLEVALLEIAPVAIRRMVVWMRRDDLGDAVLTLRMGRKRTALTVLWGRRLLLYREVEIGEERVLETLAKSLDLNADEAGELLTAYGIELRGENPAVLADPSELASAQPERAAEISATLREVLRPCFQELAEHAQKAISYTAFQARGTSIQQVYALGGPVVWPGFAEILEELLAIPVAAQNPLAELSSDATSAVSPAPHKLAVAMGHALRGLADE